MEKESSTTYPLAGLCSRWLALLETAEKRKDERFGKYAKEAYMFYNGSHDWMWRSEYAKGGGGYLHKGNQNSMPTFRMTVNRVFEAVAMFGPVLFHQYPQVDVMPVSYPKVPSEAFGVPDETGEFLQQQYMADIQRDTSAEIMSHTANWLQVEGCKLKHSRMAITEAIVKGMGVLLTEMYQPPGGSFRYPRSRYISCDNLLLDPDARCSEDIQWKAIRWRQPVNKVESKFSLPRGSLKGHIQSLEQQSTTRGRRDKKGGKERSDSYDLIEYWEVFSKNGAGDLLKTSAKAGKSRYDLSFAGPFTKMVFAKGIPFPLNLPPDVLPDQEEAFMRMQWPVPLWTDGSWPTSELGFWHDPNDVWPISLIKPAIGEIRFVNWCMSFLADKVAAVSRDYIGVAKSAGDDIQKQLTSGDGPYTVIEISELTGRSIEDVISFIKAPTFSYDIWRMVEQVLDLIDKRTGLTELVYGLTGTQMRSATEATVRSDNVNVRPQDMANSVEAWLSDTAKKECISAVWSLSGQDVAPVVGPIGAQFWDEFIGQQNFDSVVRDYSYKIASGSARRPNKAGKLQALNDFGAVIAPTLQQFAMQGMTAPWNAYMEDVADAMDIDGERYRVELPPMPEEEGPSPEDEQMAREDERFSQQIMQKEDSHDQKMRHDEESHRLKMELSRRESREQT